ncbi:MAG: aminopeptidase [Spirochaetota bacterium]
MTKPEFFERYASVVAAVGLNIQRDQEVYVRAPLEASEFVPHFVTACYRRKATYVHVEYRDQASIRARLEHAPQETLSYVPSGGLTERLRVAKAGGASLSVLGEDPKGLEGIPPSRRGPWITSLAEATSEIRELAMKDFFPWCVISIPNPAWARAVYPDLPEDEALDRLFSAVGHACRLDTPDPVAAWREHSDRLTKLASWLTEQAFDRFRFQAPGTDLTVGMPDRQRWIGTEGVSEQGITFIANLPTDEVFCAPDRRRVEGTFRSSRPLVLEGTDVGIVDFTVADGRIVEARAEREQETLDQELDLDQYARYLGEIAFVAEDSPIAELRTVFYDGLYDENAGCHLAFGNAYSNCVEGGATMSEAERREAGLNVSRQHTDVTVGSAELTITAVRADGGEFPLLRNGRWTAELERAVRW